MITDEYCEECGTGLTDEEILDGEDLCEDCKSYT